MCLSVAQDTPDTRYQTVGGYTWLHLPPQPLGEEGVRTTKEETPP